MTDRDLYKFACALEIESLAARMTPARDVFEQWARDRVDQMREEDEETT